MKRTSLFVAALMLMATAPARPVAFTAPCIDQIEDLHGDPASADLTLFVGGNEWFVMPALLAAFRRAHPEVREIFYETLPPGVLANQMHSGALEVGGLTLRVRPDVFISGKRRMEREVADGYASAPLTYASNMLAIMVKAGNPRHIRGLGDLGRSDVRVAMPNPATEGIARQISLAYAKAGGSALVTRIMSTKVHAGTTLLTSIHHRQTPLWLLDGRADAGPVWISEALYQERIHSGIIAISIPAQQNVRGLYLAAVAKGAPHLNAARAFVEFLATPNAQAIYRSYGFAAAPGSTTKEEE